MGGKAIPDSNPVDKKDIPGVLATAKKLIPAQLQKRMAGDIGSAGWKLDPAGDIDVMIEADDLVDLFDTRSNPKDPVLAAKKELEKYFIDKGIQAKVNGRNVSIGVPYSNGIAQVDVMVIQDVNIVAPYHQHGPRGAYNDPSFKGQPIFLLMNSLGKALGLKFDAFGAKLMKRDDNSVVARDRDSVAKILLNPKATGDDLNSVKSIMAALENDPQRDAKLAQARDDEAKGLIELTESYNVGSNEWFRKLLDRM